MDTKVNICNQRGWVYYFSSDVGLSALKCGKWMYFFNDKAFAEQICYDAVNKQVVSEAKHSDGDEGVACFYINVDDLDAHRRVIEFFIENRLIRKRKDGRYYNISFKLDSQTHQGEYKLYGNFDTEIKLEKFIDLQTGEWMLSQDIFNSILPLEIHLYSSVENIPLDKDTFGATNACEYIRNAFPAHTSQYSSIIGNKAHFFTGQIPESVNKDGLFYIVRFRAIFHIKNGCEPFIKCKTSLLYPAGRPLQTSDIFSNGKYYDRYIDVDGTLKRCFPEFTLTREDFNLFKNNYDILKIEILDGCYFV